jgi:hypothetical protein
MKRVPVLVTTWLTLACALTACDTVPDLPSPSLIDRPRVLALVSEPPELWPGEEASLGALLAGFDEAPELHWRACASFASTERNRQYQEMSLSQGCGGALTVELGEGPSAVLPGELTQALFDNLELAGQVLGVELPEATVRQLREDVGLPLSIEVNAEYEGAELRAIKRVLVSERETPHTNPPPPRFLLGDTPIVTDPDQAMRCVAESGETPRVDLDTKVELAPTFEGEGESEPWIERYNVIDVYGQLDEREEVASYTWFSSAGKLAASITTAPLRNQIWRTPESATCARLWLVVRDGHGGTSACALSVEVGDVADGCEP